MDNNEHGTNCISRRAVIEAIEKCHKMCCREDACGDEWIHYETVLNEVECIPPAEPKRGRWILDRSGAYCCSECMEPCAGYVMMKPRGKFCKMCGSRNEVTT